VRQVGFTLLSWKLRVKDYSREVNGGFSLGHRRKTVLGAVFSTKTICDTNNNREIVEGISQVS
jgi:hypothetical protein